jgi:hypothetical protein
VNFKTVEEAYKDFAAHVPTPDSRTSFYCGAFAALAMLLKAKDDDARTAIEKENL